MRKLIFVDEHYYCIEVDDKLQLNEAIEEAYKKFNEGQPNDNIGDNKRDYILINHQINRDVHNVGGNMEYLFTYDSDLVELKDTKIEIYKKIAKKYIANSDMLLSDEEVDEILNEEYQDLLKDENAELKKKEEQFLNNLLS